MVGAGVMLGIVVVWIAESCAYRPNLRRRVLQHGQRAQGSERLVAVVGGWGVRAFLDCVGDVGQLDGLVITGGAGGCA